MSIETINYTLAAGTLSLQVITIALIALLLMRKKIPDLKSNVEFIRTWSLWIGFLLTLASVAVTLFYSDVLGFEPCPLCWWQRIFLYPQVILFGLALWKPDVRAAALLYSMWFSAIGAAFALYHHALQMFPAGHLPCPASGPSCAKITFLEFGYVTFPMMAFTLFAFLITLTFFARERT